MTVRRSSSLVLACLLAACGGMPPAGSPASTPPAGDASPTAPGTAGPAPIATADPVAPADTSQVRIAAALAAGEIDYSTSLLYRAYALFGRAELPAEFRGADGSADDDAGLAIEARKYRADLAAAAATELEGLLARPTAAGASAASAHLAGIAGVSGMRTQLAQVGECQAVGSGARWRFTDASVPVRIWTPCHEAASGPEIDVDRVVGWVDAFYGPMTTVMGAPILDAGEADAGGSSAIDVYFVEFCVERGGECQSVGGKGLTVPAPPYAGPAGAETASGYILLSLTGLATDPSGTHNSLVHEFFHVLQYAHNFDALVAQGSVPHWFAEASAKWAETHFRRETSAAVHDFWFPRFQSSTISLHRPASPDQGYAAYIWPFFMELTAGPAAIGAAWEAIEGRTDFAGLDAAIDSALGFSGSFRDFAVKNINQALPGDALGVRYDEFDAHFRVGYQPANKLQPELAIPAGSQQLQVSSVPALSAAYYPLRPANGIEQIKFVLDGLAPADAVDVDFVYQLADGSGWKRRRAASPPGEQKFCFNRADEEFDYALLVVSNHDHADAAVGGPVAVEALDQPCDQSGQGTVTISREQHGTYTSPRNNPVEIDMVETATITFDLAADEFDPATLTATHSTVTWSHSMTSVETANDCVMVGTNEGGGTWSADDGPTVLFGWSAPDGTLFGMIPNEEMYALQVSMDNDLPEGDPNGWIQTKTDLCGEIGFGFGLPFITLAFVDGALPEDPTTLSGSRQREVPSLNPEMPPITETVTWSITLQPDQVP